MSNSIWKTPDQKPDETSSIIYTFENGEIGYFFHVKGRKFPTSWWGSQLDWDSERPVNMTKWCYLDDLIAQAGKAELLQKAVDLALGWLEKVATPAKCDDDLCREFTKQNVDEIKQLIKE